MNYEACFSNCMGVLLIECTFYAISPQSVVCFFSDMVHDAERQILKNMEEKRLHLEVLQSQSEIENKKNIASLG